MLHSLISFFSTFPPELATFFLAMTPVGELRLALPVGITLYHLTIIEAFVCAILGNMVPPTIILLFAGKFHKWVEKKSGYFAKNWIQQLHRAQESFKNYEKYGLFGLMLFIGIPLPFTGAFTGALVAFVLGVPLKKALPYIFGGVFISATIILLITVGAIKIF
jgi:uncharacterized membrane protein